MQATSVTLSDELQALLVSRETSPLKSGVKLEELLKRPQLDYECLAPFDPTRPDYPPEVFEQVEIELKYEGYIKRQQAQIREMRRLESKQIPEDICYDTIDGLRLEAREKLGKIRPQNVGQASRQRCFARRYFRFADLSCKGGRLMLEKHCFWTPSRRLGSRFRMKRSRG